MKILVTGSGGFIGTHLVKSLRLDGHAVYESEIGDLDIKWLWRESPSSDYEYIIHLAAISDIETSENIPLAAIDTNINGTYQVLSFAKRCGAKVIFASSASVYDSNLECATEESALKTENVYAHTKLQGERACQFYAEHYGVKSIVLRLFNVYGPGQRLNGGAIIPNFITKALNREEIVINGDGKQTRDFIYVEDVVDVIQKVMNIGWHGCEIFNVGSGYETNVNDLTTAIFSLTGATSLRHDLDKDGGIKKSRANVSKLQLRLKGYQPKVSLLKGLQETVAYYRCQTLS